MATPNGKTNGKAYEIVDHFQAVDECSFFIGKTVKRRAGDDRIGKQRVNRAFHIQEP